MIKTPDINFIGTPSPTKGSISNIKMVRFVFEFAAPYKISLIIIFIAMLVETFMSIAAPWPLKIILDNVVGKHSLPGYLTWLNNFSAGEHTMKLAIFAAIGVIVITVIGSISGYIENYYTESVSQYVANDLRLRLYHHLQHLSLKYYDSHQIGNMVSTIISDVSTIQSFTSSALLSILIDLLTIFGMLGVMLYLDFDFALIVVIISPILLFFISYFRKSVKKATREVRKRQSEVLGVVQQGLQSTRSVQAFGRQDEEDARLREVSMATVLASLRARRIKSMLSPIVSVTVAGCIAFVLWRSTALILKDAMTIGALTVFLAYLNKFFKPVQDLAKMTNLIAQASVGLERVQNILNADDFIPQKPDAHNPGKIKGEIIFENVAFAYDPVSPVLRNINLTIKPGMRVGICGPTGGGKSTLISLIPRFYDPTMGRILVDGTDVTDFKLDGLRDLFSFVLQDTVLFVGTIRENIAYGRPDATLDEIIEAAKIANAHEFISLMTYGYDSLVGERGLTLSGGQRQRIGIARAVVRDAPILILDEPTASLDTETEKILMEALERLMEGRTVITIAHRLSTIRDAHKIVVLKDGIIVEEGTHSELINRNELYAELHRIQYDSIAPSGESKLFP
jgi:ABC-type multidrug transport system fused ATPase/permease subunit